MSHVCVVITKRGRMLRGREGERKTRVELTVLNGWIIEFDCDTLSVLSG